MCDFCDENEATHWNYEWDALLCNECADAQDCLMESYRDPDPVTIEERRAMGDDMLYPTYDHFGRWEN
jgi:hypothetical protein